MKGGKVCSRLPVRGWGLEVQLREQVFRFVQTCCSPYFLYVYCFVLLSLSLSRLLALLLLALFSALQFFSEGRYGTVRDGDGGRGGRDAKRGTEDAGARLGSPWKSRAAELV